ncbi:hypothetical protein OPV22_028542 [Ensete ventricosum]|uniref:Secreted protein n=1 Tax=Ensete ventricosum TaxID=4639 RepID=A0AAV8PV01_ENSVE|nr:hypothetical protein OPV22_028542 [Ensete ventricosum]RWW07782.1 hypothetical protein GW17_00028816 [Ensete ventricosum]
MVAMLLTGADAAVVVVVGLELDEGTAILSSTYQEESATRSLPLAWRSSSRPFPTFRTAHFFLSPASIRPSKYLLLLSSYYPLFHLPLARSLLAMAIPSLTDRNPTGLVA